MKYFSDYVKDLFSIWKLMKMITWHVFRLVYEVFVLEKKRKKKKEKKRKHEN